MKQIRISVTRVKPGKEDFSGKWEKETRYSRDGKIVYEYQYGPDLETESTYAYDHDGLLVSKDTETGIQTKNRRLYSYDPKGRLLKVKSIYDGGASELDSDYKWNEEGTECRVDYCLTKRGEKLSSWYTVDQYKGDLMIKSVKHDMKGRVQEIESFSHYPDGTLLDYVLTTISDPEGNPVEETLIHGYDNAGRLIRSIYPEDEVFEFKYELDSEGNWIHRTEWDQSGKIVDELVRELTYWEEDD